MSKLNGEIKKMALRIAAGEGAYTARQRDSAMMSFLMDLHEVVSGEGGHDDRLRVLEKYPETARAIIKIVLGVGAVAGSVAAIYGLYLLVT